MLRVFVKLQSFYKCQHNLTQLYEIPITSSRDSQELQQQSLVQQPFDISCKLLFIIIILKSLNQIEQCIMLRSIFNYLNKNRFGQLISKNTILQKGKLKANDPQTYQLQIKTSNIKENFSIIIPKTANLTTLTKELNQVQYNCNQLLPLPSTTPIQILINRFFFISSPQYGTFLVEGQSFDYGKSDEIVEGISSLQLPVITKKQVSNYFSRINQWWQFHTGKNILDPTSKLDTNTVRKILVQAVIDPLPQERRIIQIQNEWQIAYWQVQRLKKQKLRAEQISLRRARWVMSIGLLFLGGNIFYIWYGTYYLFSWDIIQPQAYFISYIGAFLVGLTFFRLKRPYSNVAFRQYLVEKLRERVYKQIGFSTQELYKAQLRLITLESKLKDYYLKRL